MDNMLEITGLHHSYRMGENTLEIIRGADFKLEKGKWCCIYGASGSGKTTLLNLAGTLEQPVSGKIMINGTDVSRLPRRAAAAFRGRHIGFIFQSYHLIPELSVLENVCFAASFAGKGVKNASRRAQFLLEAVGLKERVHHYPSELSGGERQRCAIARSLINEPELILADEPTGNLDRETGSGIINLFCSLREQNPELTILMITHNPEVASFADCTYKLENGVLTQISN